MVQNTSPPSPCPFGPCSACWGGTDALQPALGHHARCKSGAEPEAAIYGVLGGLLSPSEATSPGQPCYKERVSLQQAPRMPAPKLGSQV